MQFGATPIMLQAAPLARKAVVLPPAVTETLQNMRNLLHDSAGRDNLRLCDFSKDPKDTWYMYGEPMECIRRHVRTPNSEFRQGIYWVFQHDWSTKQRAHSNALVEPLIDLIKEEALFEDPEARKIVVDHYKYVYGEPPPAPALSIEPSRVPMRVAPAPGGPPEAAPVPIPPPLPNGLPGDEGDLAPNGEPAPNGALVPEPGAEEFPWMWVGIGAGALLLVGGGIYYMTKKK